MLSLDLTSFIRRQWWQRIRKVEPRPLMFHPQYFERVRSYCNNCSAFARPDNLFWRFYSLLRRKMVFQLLVASSRIFLLKDLEHFEIDSSMLHKPFALQIVLSTYTLAFLSITYWCTSSMRMKHTCENRLCCTPADAVCALKYSLVPTVPTTKFKRRCRIYCKTLRNWKSLIINWRNGKTSRFCKEIRFEHVFLNNFVSRCY